MVLLKQKFPYNFDYIIQNQDVEDEQKICYYSFNLYDAEHYKIIPELTNKWYFDRCTQLTLGCYIHDEQLYENFMLNLFPSKVKDLKITHYDVMEQYDKIWYDEIFINNACLITDEVRFCRVRLDKEDIAHLLEIFSHVKSIWFMNCELDINGSIEFKEVYYQIEMLSIIN